MKRQLKPILTICAMAALLSACSRPDAPATGATLPAASTVSVPLATEASVTTAAPPVADRSAMPATPSATAPEDRLEPASIENARLPGGGQLADDPVPAKRKN